MQFSFIVDPDKKKHKTHRKGKINFLEHVIATVTVDYPERGVLEVVLVSPAGKIQE